MEIDKLKKWLEVTQRFQSDGFWNQIFDEKGANKTGGNPPQNPFTTVQDFFPKCDLYETEDVLVVEAEIPGILKEDLHISVHQQLLTISGEFKTLQQNRKYYIKERANRTFKKELTLPYPIENNKIQTEIRSGVLIIVMPFHREEVENIPITFANSNPE